MWSLESLLTPVFTFAGHSDVPREFVWRTLNSEGASSQYQMLSWSRDQTLRFWTINSEQMAVFFDFFSFLNTSQLVVRCHEVQTI